jgi:hypothetical protein
MYRSSAAKNHLVLSFVLFSGSLSIVAQGPGDDGAGCRLHIHVVSRYGNTLPYVLDFFANTKDNAEMSSRFKGLTGENLPAGRYRYRLSRKGVEIRELDITGEVDLSLPNQWLTLVPTGFVSVNSAGQVGAIDLGGIHSRKPVVGKVIPAPGSATSTWIRCQSLFTHDYIEVSVAADGSFIVPGDLSGSFVLIVLQGEHVLQTQEVSFGLPGPAPNIEISLPDHSRNGERAPHD